MALKGTTRIELTNVKTGKVEVIEKDNLVTNAVPSILDNPFAWQLKSSYNSSCFAGNILPLCPNLFGGILLYEDAIPEDVDQLYAQTGNKLVGYSSNNVNSLTDIMRGSMNQTESGVLEDNSGYRFVFDFETSQANGTISAVGLTSKWGGMAGYGSKELENTQSPTVMHQNADSMSQKDAFSYMHMIHYDAETGIATAVYVSGQNMITVDKIKLHTKEWKLTRSINLIDATQRTETQIIETEVFAGTSVSGKYLYLNFCDGGDGYIWGIGHSGNAQGNPTGEASVDWIKIKLDDLSFEEGTWTINATLYPLGRQHNNPLAAVAEQYKYGDRSDSVILDGYLYCLNNALTGIYKINLSNVTDIKFIEHPNKTLITQNSYAASTKVIYYYPSANIVIASNRVCLRDGWLNDDEIVMCMGTSGNSAKADSNLNDGWIDNDQIGSYPQHICSGLHPLKLGAFSLYYLGYNTSVYARILLNSPYLATINNLPTPVEKTADKTMKITYILREES